MIWAAIVAWAVLAGGMAIGAVHWITKRDQRRRMKAYEEILRDKGVQKAPDETIKEALLRARRQEQGVPSVRPPPEFARSTLQRPASRPDWRTDSSTKHVGGHTSESNPGFKAVAPRPAPRAGLILPKPYPVEPRLRHK
jgi:hypothetical protein